MGEKPVLIYFDGRGRGEIIRLTLTALEIEFEEKNVNTRSDFLKLVDDGDLLFNQIPLLIMDNMKMVQTNAIVRHLFRTRGSNDGLTPQEQTMSDIYYEGTRDFFIGFIRIGFVPEETALKECKELLMPKYLPLFNKILEKSDSGYFVGSSLTMADVGFLEVLLAIEEYFGITPIEEHPGIKKFYGIMNGLPQIEKYRKEIRKPKNSAAYIATVQKSLGGT